MPVLWILAFGALKHLRELSVSQSLLSCSPLSLSLPELPSITIPPWSPFCSCSTSPIVSLLLLFEHKSAEVRKRQLGCPSQDTISVHVWLHVRGRDAASQLPSVLQPQHEDPPGSVPLTTRAVHMGMPPLIPAISSAPLHDAIDSDFLMFILILPALHLLLL